MSSTAAAPTKYIPQIRTNSPEPNRDPITISSLPQFSQTYSAGAESFASLASARCILSHRRSSVRKLSLVCVAAALAAGCAKSPESIAPAYISPLSYQNFACDQLAEENVRVAAALAQASQQQRDARTNDTVGVIFLGLPVSTLSGGNVADQVARLKGEQQTLGQVAMQKRCTPNAAASHTVSG
jgi:hypothetical protein